MLQTSIHCPSNASAHISFSTAGTGVLSVWNAAGEQLANATDQVYAGLFDEEVVLNVSLAAGWNDLQIKTLSHYSTAAGWEAQASVDTGASGCAIDACGPYSAAPFCTSDKMPEVKLGRLEAIEQLKKVVHTLPPEEASRRFKKLWDEHGLTEPPARQDMIDHFPSDGEQSH